MQKLSDQEVAAKLKTLQGWERIDLGGKPAIAKTFKTGNFLAGLGFVTKIAVLAERVNHHPDVVLTYPRVTVQLTTHDAGGLTHKDFDLAANLDQIKP